MVRTDGASVAVLFEEGPLLVTAVRRHAVDLGVDLGVDRSNPAY